VSVRHIFIADWLALGRSQAARLPIAVADDPGLPRSPACGRRHAPEPLQRASESARSLTAARHNERTMDMVIGSGFLVTILIILAIIYLAKRL
jgi:hypothetical protein